jgi:hypothetical protein
MLIIYHYLTGKLAIIKILSAKIFPERSSALNRKSGKKQEKIPPASREGFKNRFCLS